MPALLIKASIRPKASQAFRTEFWIVGPSADKSSSTATALRMEEEEDDDEGIVKLRLLIWSQRDLRRSTRRAAATMKQPDLARSRQNSRPSPDDAPVTITTFPWRSTHASNSIALVVAITCYCFAFHPNSLSLSLTQRLTQSQVRN